jgi:glycerol-3-phosphate dehydrogenase (NAD(P)+)
MSAPSVSVIGAGGWGTAIALLLARKGIEVSVWGHDPVHVEAMRTSRINEKYLPGIELPATISPTTSLDDCLGCDILFVAVPSRYLGEVTGQLHAGAGSRKPILVSCTKGIEREQGLLMTEVMNHAFPGATAAVLSGPNLAGEIGRGIPAAAVIGCDDAAALAQVQALFEGTTFRPYSSADMRGIQLGGALKNIFAIASGVSDGFGLGENAKAALVTRSLAEMIRLGVAMGGQRETFSGLSGIGDLMVTCFSERSRNHQVGFRLGRGESLASITASMTTVAEGIPTAASAWAAARRLGVETPLVDAVYAVLEGKVSPAEAMQSLMSRQLKAEE